MIEIQINKTVVSRVPFELLKKISALVARELKIKKNYQVSVAVVSALAIKKLNNQYRKKNKVTDVLSFTYNQDNQLGDILICYSQLLKQATQKKHSAQKEFAILFLHGLLHLLGFDHEKETQAQKMETLEEKVLKKIYDKC